MATYPQKLHHVVAHRGASADAPENTLSALKLAIDQGAGSVEVDAMISSDGEAFLHHDDKLERCTNGAGYLCASSSAELDKLDASGGNKKFANEALPRLSSAVDLLIQHGIGLNLEIKPTPGLEAATAAAVVNSLKPHWPGDLPLVLSSFSKDALVEAKKLWPDAPRALITCAVPGNWREALADLQCKNFHMAAPLLKADIAEQIKSAGYGLYCYTVNEVSEARSLLGMGVDGVFTDKPKLLLDSVS